MIDRMHRPLPWLLSLALLACGDDGDPSGDTDGSTSTGSASLTATTEATLSTSTSSSSSESASASSGSTTDEPTSGTTMEEPSTGEPSTGEPSTGSDTESSGSSSTGEPDTSSSSGVLLCEVDAIVEDAAMGKRDPVDCGFVQLGDPLNVWQAAQVCALENFENESAFTLVAELQGIDSDVFIGYAGSVGEEYVASQFFSDSFGGAVTIYGTTPCEIAAVAGCVVTVGDLCLECVDPPASVTICP